MGQVLLELESVEEQEAFNERFQKLGDSEQQTLRHLEHLAGAGDGLHDADLLSDEVDGDALKALSEEARKLLAEMLQIDVDRLNDMISILTEVKEPVEPEEPEEEYGQVEPGIYKVVIDWPQMNFLAVGSDDVAGTLVKGDEVQVLGRYGADPRFLFFRVDKNGGEVMGRLYEDFLQKVS